MINQLRATVVAAALWNVLRHSCGRGPGTWSRTRVITAAGPSRNGWPRNAPSPKPPEPGTPNSPTTSPNAPPAPARAPAPPPTARPPRSAPERIFGSSLSSLLNARAAHAHARARESKPAGPDSNKVDEADAPFARADSCLSLGSSEGASGGLIAELKPRMECCRKMVCFALLPHREQFSEDKHRRAA